MPTETERMMDESEVRVWRGGWWVRDWERGESFVFEKERMSETGSSLPNNNKYKKI